jgi:hypothetical protein
VDRGYRTIELRASVMRQYITHLTHGTQALNPQEFTIGAKHVSKYNRLVRRLGATGQMQEILADDSLDK